MVADRGGLAVGRVALPPPRLADRPVRLAPRPAYLAGREQLLADLEARLAGAGNAEGPRIVPLYGLGGAGKTSVAVTYAHQRQAGLGLVWQFPAEDPVAMAAGFTELAAQLGAQLGDIRDPVALVHGMLASRAGGWLLIFDNAPDAASVAEALPPAGDGQVIITSRSAHWPVGTGIEVPVLEQDAAAGFLQARTGDADRVAAQELSGELGGLPLALEQAAAYITAVGGDLAGYLSRYRDRRADLLSRGDPAGYDKRVTTTWSLSFTRLQHDTPQAAALLNLLACCAPDAIPYRRLLRPGTSAPDALPDGPGAALGPLLNDELAVDDAVDALRRYSLISAPAGGAVSVHRLVQAITRAQLPVGQTESWRQAAASLIAAALPGDPQDPGNWAAFAVLLPHVLAAVPVTSEPAAQAASYLGYSGSYAAARDLQEQILTASQRELGSDHPRILAVRAYLAGWAGMAGDAAGARDQYAALLPVLERVSGAEHPDTLDARADLAFWTLSAGNADDARAQFAALLPVRERVSGPEHPDTLTARAYLATWVGADGDAAGARDQYAALLPVRERVSGPEHPATLDARAELARWVGEAGDAAGARDRYAALLPLIERVSGPEHPQTLSVRAELARWVGEAGDAAGARDRYAALLPLAERVLGPGHFLTLADRAELARWVGEAGDAAGARDQYAALLPVRERVSGPEHPDTLDARAYLALWAGLAGDAPGARERFAALLPVRERVCGPEHPDTLAIRAELAYWAGEAGDAAGARDEYAALLPLAERVYGAEDPGTRNVRAELARWARKAAGPWLRRIRPFR